ncbi:pyridoxamine 5'-phosphate oxidase family protein [Anaerocolumna sp. AGMB13025]|uniref:pyridoxamine 5'-phosphate oxidase family protein n=1 Tax=Anaerocolumna sp. AGMB13025 TaxID=3039116 RepID=UPI00241FEB65|nr:pyridoxamine 5'-phosphate oxidase family protein [Anaerocolumna sp. AGMB13025]WFR58864.1 pyridoxamine 5'-phosphate oxidase family protein [Anaerocolumna sp. AGMB13025]
MLSDKFHEVLENEGIVTIVTWGNEEPHIVNEWNSYLVVTEDERILIPAGIMHTTEKNIKVNNKIKMALGSKNVKGYDNYQGTGFVIEGTARFISSGAEFNMMKKKFEFLSRVLEITVTSAKQML